MLLLLLVVLFSRFLDGYCYYYCCCCSCCCCLLMISRRGVVFVEYIFIHLWVWVCVTSGDIYSAANNVHGVWRSIANEALRSIRYPRSVFLVWHDRCPRGGGTLLKIIIIFVHRLTCHNIARSAPPRIECGFPGGDGCQTNERWRKQQTVTASIRIVVVVFSTLCVLTVRVYVYVCVCASRIDRRQFWTSDSSMRGRENVSAIADTGIHRERHVRTASGGRWRPCPQLCEGRSSPPWQCPHLELNVCVYPSPIYLFIYIHTYIYIHEFIYVYVAKYDRLRELLSRDEADQRLKVRTMHSNWLGVLWCLGTFYGFGSSAGWNPFEASRGEWVMNVTTLRTAVPFPGGTLGRVCWKMNNWLNS